jgi:hypothetical protein
LYIVEESVRAERWGAIEILLFWTIIILDREIR